MTEQVRRDKLREKIEEDHAKIQENMVNKQLSTNRTQFSDSMEYSYKPTIEVNEESLDRYLK